MCKDNDLPCDGRDLVANPHPKHLVCTLGDGVAEPHKLATDSPGALDVRRLYRLDAPLARRDGTDPNATRYSICPRPSLKTPNPSWRRAVPTLICRLFVRTRLLGGCSMSSSVPSSSPFWGSMNFNRRHIHIKPVQQPARPPFDISLCISTMGLSLHSSTAYMMAPAMTAAGAASSRTGDSAFLKIAWPHWRL